VPRFFRHTLQLGFLLAFAIGHSYFALHSLGQQKLEKIENCQFIETSWCDGDSFRVVDPTGKEFTVRLYGVDCLEYRVTSDSDSRRLRAQRRYFGISKYGNSAETSIAAAKQAGQQAREYIIERLGGKKFTVVTSFADGRGDPKFKRFYAFVLLQDANTGKEIDLAEELVRQGLARAFGVSRSTIDGRTRDEYRDSIKDVELQAISKRAGVWKLTDWDQLPIERRAAREEEAEINLAKKSAPLDGSAKIDINSASRDELMRLPGIGETIANRIVEGRPYADIDAVLKVSGIGPKTLEKIRSHIKN